MIFSPIVFTPNENQPIFPSSAAAIERGAVITKFFDKDVKGQATHIQIHRYAMRAVDLIATAGSSHEGMRNTLTYSGNLAGVGNSTVKHVPVPASL
jgi:2-keto-3-deoxy-6-phosphogluconate aldolase